MRGPIASLQAQCAARGATQEEMAAELQKLYAQHGVSPMAAVIPALAQAPVFMSAFLGLRRLAETFPEAHAGGTLWFIDLGARDLTYTLPVLSSASALALVWLSVVPPAGANAAELATHKKMRLLFGGVTLISLPVAVSMPASVLVFWMANNAFSLVYAAAVTRDTPVRRALGLPPPGAPPPDQPQPGAQLLPTFGGAGGASQAAAPPPPPLSDADARQARMQTAESLAKLAAAMKAAGKTAEAEAMLRRSEELRSGLPEGNSGDDAAK